MSTRVRSLTAAVRARPRFAAAGVALAACLTLATGCTLGPAVLRTGRIPYNEVIQQTNDEQLLLNLVRLRYGVSPLFLDVGSVSAQYVVAQSADVRGTLNENIPFQQINPDQLSLGAGIAIEERPTIVYTPLQGEQFAARLMAPLPLETIALAARSGWRIDRVLRLAVQSLNQLDNASSASGPTPAAAPQAEEFSRAVQLLRSLQVGGRLRFESHADAAVLSDPIPAERISVADALAATQAGYRLRRAEDGGGYVLVDNRPALAWRIPESVEAAPETSELIELLRLDPQRRVFSLRSVAEQALSDRSNGDAIEVVPRSLLGAMFYLSQAVEVPQEHRERGWVMITRDQNGQEFDWQTLLGELLTIHTARLRPRDAAVATRYRDHWFYIDARDVNSKSTFALLNQLFALQAGTTASGGLQLTLPVGG